MTLPQFVDTVFVFVLVVLIFDTVAGIVTVAVENDTFVAVVVVEVVAVAALLDTLVVAAAV